MMSAAIMGATAFQKGLGAIHALSHPIGAMYHTHHGTTNAVCMPAVLQFNRPAIEGVIEQATKYLGISGGFDGFCAYVDELNASLGIPKTLTAMGIDTPNVERIVAGALTDPSTGGNPIEMTKENTTKLLLEIIG
jgi:4-hydroxybutyrate dehydrogenase